jgi:hypothetical protein
MIHLTIFACSLQYDFIFNSEKHQKLLMTTVHHIVMNYDVVFPSCFGTPTQSRQNTLYVTAAFPYKGCAILRAERWAYHTITFTCEPLPLGLAERGGK